MVSNPTGRSSVENTSRKKHAAESSRFTAFDWEKTAYSLFDTMFGRLTASVTNEGDIVTGSVG